MELQRLPLFYLLFAGTEVLGAFETSTIDRVRVPVLQMIFQVVGSGCRINVGRELPLHHIADSTWELQCNLATLKASST